MNPPMNPRHLPSQPRAQTPQLNTAAATNSFASDPRVHFSLADQKWVFEADDGSEMEWDTARGAWVPRLGEEEVAQQQAAYAVQGVDESVPAAPVLARQNGKKRKADQVTPQQTSTERNYYNDDDDDDDDDDNNTNTNTSSSIASTSNLSGPPAQNKPNKKAKPPKANTAIFVSHLPATTTIPLLQTVFSKAGLILEDVDGNARIKLYHDETTGLFKGEALIVYLQAASVDLAIRLLDETELELGKGQQVMKVSEAQAWRKKSGTAGEGNADDKGNAEGKQKPKRTELEKKKLSKRAEKLNQRLTEWSSDEDDNSAAIVARARSNKVVVLQGMFTLKELEDDPTLLLELKEDVRDECETMGTVTNVTLYDKEEEGIITIRFKDEVSAQACIAKMNGRFFGGRSIVASLLDPKQKYRRTGQGVSLEGTGLDLEADEEASKAEKERLARYAEWLEKGGDEEGGAEKAS
ncbi:BZ3500_MvSof-1268-A1-R1_Chr1-3g01720 [Microbotryum saponariae]|uniref:BZ3500_MvSof-1268-A1-R1_Chr1-3g01720 protein n=1 Tax=Microbotryum saponariae TaxID=289078 RepID=A0A2X0KEM7_9BASI|nr:BZ3500_MvSof-1268-A1-R1_Chr1-3g01720 [Microbotryum saponariae]SCZ94425.1 BZ3501_MvSof-1269-A2-R1_Chr1-3g01321 [Microbotryum saponariae]